ARGILRTGLPTLPSGALYWRAPLYHYLAAPLAAGADWLPRVLSILCAAVTGLILVRIGREIAGRSVAWLAGALFAVSLIEISLAREIRMYSLYQPLALLAFLLLHRFWATGDLRWGWRSALVILLSLTCHELAVTLALLYLPIAVRHARPRVWAFAIGAVACFGLLHVGYRRLLASTFCPGPGAIDPGDVIPNAPFRTLITTHPLAFAPSMLGVAGVALIVGVPVVVMALVTRRVTRELYPLRRIAAAAAVTAALAAAGFALAGVAAGILVLVALERRELLPGRSGAIVFAIVAGWVLALAALWLAIGRAHGLTTPDLLLGMTRWPGRLVRLLLWPPAFAVATGACALAVAWRAWQGRGSESLRFTVIAIAWLVVSRGVLGDRTQIRYLVDVWPLGELVAAAGVIALVQRARRAGRAPALALGAAMIVAALMLPGTSPADIVGFLSRGPGARTAAADRLDTPAADLRGASAWLAPRLRPDDFVIASDWLSTYCYVGRVDGWLRAEDYVWQSRPVGSVLRDCYLGARVLPDLGSLLDVARDHPLWIVAGGEELDGSASRLFPPDVRAWLLRRQPAFVAADRETRVYRIDAAAR
ncbi:MAG: glycosyltransferase family 39 protein, partial [Candidatus Eisenbacteria bacterium]|nr:glycosyltransferase family 39 protein [Candidatus Eisenbacteria bacterium]